MNLAAIDPKLLLLLDALFEEIHLARAAQRIGLSLPAAASALERCRQLLGDPLLEDGGQSMQLTPAALALRAPLRQALAASGHGQAAAPGTADITRMARRVRVLVADYPGLMVAPPLQRALTASAPLLDIEWQTWQGEAHAAASLERGETDLAITALARASTHLRQRELLQERCVAVMRHDHPAAQQLTVQKWLAYPHLEVSSLDRLNHTVREQVAAQGLIRRIGVTVPHFLLAAPLLLQSDLIALMPMHCVPSTTNLGALACCRPPLPVPGLPLHLAWHRRADDDIALRHVAQALERVIQSEVAGR